MEVLWQIPTTVPRFIAWFLEYFKQYEWLCIKTDADDSSHVVFTLKPPQVSQLRDDKAFITIQAECENIAIDGTATRVDSLWPAVDIRLIQLQNETIEFRGRFHHPGLNLFYEKVLDAIKSRWVVENLAEQENTSKAHPGKSKRGSRRFTVEEKKKALEEWDSLDRDLRAVTLEEWLEEKFGATGGQLNVPASTFYGWRKQIKS